MEKTLKDDRFIIGLLAITAFFLWVNFNSLLGGIYFGMIVLYLISIWTKMPHIEIWNNRHSLISTLIVSGVVFIAYMTIAHYVVSNVNPNIKFALADFSILDKIAEKVDIPVLSTNPQIRLAVYGIFVPIAETVFALSFVLLLWAKGLNTPIEFSPTNFKMYWVAVLVGIVMAFLHFTTRQLSEYALITDALFFGISAILIFYRKQLLEAVLFHVYLNVGVLR